MLDMMISIAEAGSFKGFPVLERDRIIRHTLSIAPSLLALGALNCQAFFVSSILALDAIPSRLFLPARGGDARE